MVQAVSNLIKDNESDTEEFICGICRDDFSDFETRCCHYFHENCLYRWFNAPSNREGKFLCPYCRTPISLADLVERFFREGSKGKLSLECLEFDAQEFGLLNIYNLSNKNLPLKLLVQYFIKKNRWDINKPFDERFGYYFIHLAAKSGHLNLLEFILLKGAKIDPKTCDGETALHIAVENNHLDVVKALVLAGADLNAQDIDYCTPLHLAAIESDIEIVKFLLENGANLKIRNNKNQSCLDNLIEFKGEIVDINFFKKLFENVTPETLDFCLYSACGTKNIEIVKDLIDKGADVNFKYINGYTALHNAAAKGTPEIVNLLLDKGADIEAKEDENSETPLLTACCHPNLNIIKALINRGANLHVQSKYGCTVFQQACINSEEEVIDFFLDLEPDIFIKTPYQQEMFFILIQDFPHLFERIKGKLLDCGNNGISILHAICEVDDYNLFLEFVEKGFDINALNIYDETPLFCSNGEKIIEELINLSVDVNFKGRNGHTPFLMSCEGVNDLFNTLINNEKVDFHHVCDEKRNSLHYSVLYSELDFVKALLQKGVNYDQVDVYGHSPVYYTLFNENGKLRSFNFETINTALKDIMKVFYHAGARFEELKMDDESTNPIIKYYNQFYKKQGKYQKRLTSVIS